MPKPTPASMSKSLAPVLDGLTLRAAGFIVTIYGDAIVPRGGEAWIGTIIDACAQVGISETLVRTAVSRLVADGQLEGRKQGRRSFYRLTEAAGADFASAARVIYGPPEPWEWRFVWVPEALSDELTPTLERQGFARLRPQMMVGPARVALSEAVLSFAADPMVGEQSLPEFAGQAWDLSQHAATYQAFLDRFSPLASHLSELSGADALAARLVLVHVWRGALLRDPRLPVEALPGDWPGHAARGLFARLYRALFAASESYLGDEMLPLAGDLEPRRRPSEDALTLLEAAEQALSAPQVQRRQSVLVEHVEE